MPIIRPPTSIQPPQNLTPDNQMTKVENFSQNVKFLTFFLKKKESLIGGHSGEKQVPIVRSKSIQPPHNITVTSGKG